MDFGEKGKSNDALIERLKSFMDIADDFDKQKLITYGYYHGYKGYRFFKTSSNRIPYSKIEELISVIDYDNYLKALLYSPLMFIETALKNIVINEIVSDSPYINFNDIYINLMSDSIDDTKLRRKRLELRDHVYKALSDSYNRQSMIVKHFYDGGTEVPIWAIFEVISLNDLSNFVKCFNEDIRINLSSRLNMLLTSDSKVFTLADTITMIRDLRNSVAHNQIVFDVRFRNYKPKNTVVNWVQYETKLDNIIFDSITDYVILICCILKNIGYEKDKIEMFIYDYFGLIDQAYKTLPDIIYNKIINTNARHKINTVYRYLGK